jgi:uncharacterized protein
MTLNPTRLRLQRDNQPGCPPYILGSTHVRDVPADPGDPHHDRVLIALPWSYNDEPLRSYPVVYLCDGYWDFPLLVGIYGHLFVAKGVPEFILVGLAYGGDNPNPDELRLLDLAPPTRDHDYLDRLRRKIMPFVESEYAVDTSFRCIAGVSIGAAFGISALYRAPGLFQASIALIPRADAFDRWLFRLDAQFSRTSVIDRLTLQRKELAARVFLAAAGDDRPDITRAVEEFSHQLHLRKYRFLEQEYRLIDGENHGSLKPEGMNRGLRHVFAPFMTAAPR